MRLRFGPRGREESSTSPDAFLRSGPVRTRKLPDTADFAGRAPRATPDRVRDVGSEGFRELGKPVRQLLLTHPSTPTDLGERLEVVVPPLPCGVHDRVDARNAG